MSSINTKTLGGAVGLGKLLFSSVASAGKSQLGVTKLNLDMSPASNAQVCYTSTEKLDPGQAMPSNVTVVINPTAMAAVQMNFTVGDLLPSSQDYVVFLAYSTDKTASPPILTPRSDEKLLLDMSSLEVLGSYEFPKVKEMPQPTTRVGQAQSKPRQKLNFIVNLSADQIPALMRAGLNKIYLQALIVGKGDFERNVWDSALVSKVNSIAFSANQCAQADASVQADTTGGKTLKPAGTTTTTLSKSGSTSTTTSGKTAPTGGTTPSTGGKS